MDIRAKLKALMHVMSFPLPERRAWEKFGKSQGETGEKLTHVHTESVPLPSFNFNDQSTCTLVSKAESSESNHRTKRKCRCKFQINR